MLDKTLGYILCCQSPALFLAALALLVAYLAGRKHRVKAFFRPLLCILCAAGAVALYFLGIYKEYFTIRDFFVIRAAGWIGLAIAAFFVLLALVRAFFAAADARAPVALRPHHAAGDGNVTARTASSATDSCAGIVTPSFDRSTGNLDMMRIFRLVLSVLIAAADSCSA